MDDLIQIENKIFIIRGQPVMLDSDLAEIYGYTTKNFNRQVKNNIEKFDDDFMFQLSQDEIQKLRCKNFTANISPMSRSLPYVFTEQGIYMLMTVLKGDLAISQSKALIRLFRQMRQYFSNNDSILRRLDTAENKIETLFSLMDKYKIEDKHGIYFQGQIYDAFSLFQQLIQKAHKEIILIDNYIDLSVLDSLSAKNKDVNVTIYTKNNTPVTPLAVHKFNLQYPTLTIKQTNTMHDRFLIIDNTELYHIGASLKDLGKKCFAFEQFDDANTLIPLILQAL